MRRAQRVVEARVSAQLMEHVGHDPDIVHATIHTLAFNHTMGAQLRVSKAREAFHTYSIEWTPEEIRG